MKAYALADPNMGDLVQREHTQNYGRIEVGTAWGQEHIKVVISPKGCKVGPRPRLLLRTNRKSHTRYALSIGTKINDLG